MLIAVDALGVSVVIRRAPFRMAKGATNLLFNQCGPLQSRSCKVTTFFDPSIF